MITCMGLVVGMVETPYPQDLINTCAKFLALYPHLQRIGVVFEVENIPYATLRGIGGDNIFLFRCCGTFMTNEEI